jgi:hypothetical protein
MLQRRVLRTKRDWVAVGGVVSLLTVLAMSSCSGDAAHGEPGGGQAGEAAAGVGQTVEGGMGPVAKGGSAAMPEGGHDTVVEGGAAGSGGEGGAEPPAFRVIATDPLDAAVDAQPDGSIVITFSQELNAASVSSESIELRDVFLDAAVPAELSVAGEKVTIAPAARLGLVADYEVTVDQAVTDMTGVGLAEDFNFAFTVRDGTWKETQLATGEITYMSQSLGLDDAGTAFITWIVRNQNAYCPTTARRVPLLGGPDEPEVLTPTTIEADCRYPRTSATGIGLAAASWEEDTGSYVAQYRGGEWVGSTPLTTPTALGHVNVGVAPYGVVHLLVLTGGVMVARHTTPAGEWIPTSDALTAAGHEPRGSASLAFEADGDGIAAWRSKDVDKYEMILVARYSQAQNAWSPAVRLPGSLAPEVTAVHYRGSPAIAINAAGEIVVVWVRGSEVGAKLYANTYANDAWQNPVPVSIEAGGLTYQEPPGLVVVGSDFVAAWNQAVGGVNNTYTARLSQGVWSAPQLRSSGVTSGLSRMPRLGVDEHQNLLLVWPRATAAAGVYDYVQARYLRSTGSWYGPTEGFTTITDKYIDESASELSIPNYTVGLPFATAPNGVAAAGYASRPPDNPGRQYLTNPMLATFH